MGCHSACAPERSFCRCRLLYGGTFCPPLLYRALLAPLPLPQFVFYSLAITLPRVAIFTALGYYFGASYDTIATYLQSGEYLMAAAVITVLAVWWAYHKSTALVAHGLEAV